MFKKSISIRQIIPFLAILLVLNAQTIPSSLLLLRENPQIKHKSDDHSEIVFNGPSEDIVLKLNIKFDPTLKHFRIQEVQQVECSGETQQEQEIVTVVTKEIKTVNQQKKEVKSSQGLKQHQNTLKVVSKPNALISNPVSVSTVLTGKPIVLNTPKVAQSQVTNKIVTSQATKNIQKQAIKIEQAKPVVTNMPIKKVNLGVNSNVVQNSKIEQVKTPIISQENKGKVNFIQTKEVKVPKPQIEETKPVRFQSEQVKAPKPQIVKVQEVKVQKPQIEIEETKPLNVQSEGSQSFLQNQGSQNSPGPIASKRPSKTNLSSQSQTESSTKTPSSSSSAPNTKWKIL